MEIPFLEPPGLVSQFMRQSAQFMHAALPAGEILKQLCIIKIKTI